MKSILIDSCIFCLQLNSENGIEEVSYETFRRAIDFVFTFKILSTLEEDRRKVCRSCVDCIMEFYDYATQVKKNQESINSLETEYKEQLAGESICPTKVEPPRTTADPSSSVIATDIISDESDSERKDPVAITDDDLDVEESSQSSKSHTNARKQNATETFNCPRCNESFKFKSFLAKHMKSHVDCAICGISFTNRAAMRKHVREMHKTDRIAICEICGKQVGGTKNLKQHMEAYHIAKPVEILECEFCNKTFHQSASLRSHVKAIHKEAGHSFACDICPKVFSTSRSLRAHKIRCHVESRYCCSICQKQFKHGKNYKEHMAAHTGITLYECDVCGHGFNSNANMYAHRKHKHPVEWKEKKAERFMSRRKQLNSESST